MDGQQNGYQTASILKSGVEQTNCDENVKLPQTNLEPKKRQTSRSDRDIAEQQAWGIIDVCSFYVQAFQRSRQK